MFETVRRIGRWTALLTIAAAIGCGDEEPTDPAAPSAGAVAGSAAAGTGGGGMGSPGAPAGTGAAATGGSGGTAAEPTTMSPDAGVTEAGMDGSAIAPPTDSGAATPAGDFGRTASQLVESLTLGWNLGNSLDAPEGETAWGNPPATGDLLQEVADQGFDVVRVPVTWSLHMGAAPEFRIDEAWMARVAEVVRLALDRGLYVIINLHHDGADGYDGVEWLTLNDASGAVSADNNRSVEQRFTAVWQQIASHFADFGERLIFESMNEIHDGYDAPNPQYYDIINHLNQVFVDTVRASGGNNGKRYLLVPGYNTNIDYTVAGFIAPNDTLPDRLILSVHYYDPWDFAGAGSTPSWGSQAPGNDGWGQEDHVRQQFDKLQAEYIGRGLPVIMGEYGAVRRAGDEKYRRYYMEYVTKAASDRGILPIYWDNGGEGTGQDAFGLIGRSSLGVLSPAILEAMMRAVGDGYTLDDIARP